MKAAILKQWGKIEVEDTPTPTISNSECLVKVQYAGVCGSDVHIYKGTNPIAITPITPGHEFAGEIAQLPENHNNDLKVGQKVAVRPLVSCGKCDPCLEDVGHLCQSLTVIGVNAHGGFAEYVAVPLDALIPVSEELPTAIAALCEPFAVGLHTCRQGNVQQGDNVLVVGGGAIGIAAGLMAKELGASQIIISEPKERRRALAELHGFRSIDPVSKDFTKQVQNFVGKRGFDVIIETSGTPHGMENSIDAVKAKGTIVCIGFPEGGHLPYSVTKAILKEVTLTGSRVYTKKDYIDTTRLLEKTYFDKSINFESYISSTHPLEKLEQCINLVADGVEDGKVLLQIA